MWAVEGIPALHTVRAALRMRRHSPVPDRDGISTGSLQTGLLMLNLPCSNIHKSQCSANALLTRLRTSLGAARPRVAGVFRQSEAGE